MLLAHPRLRDAGEALIAAANEAGGRDNITVRPPAPRGGELPGSPHGGQARSATRRRCPATQADRLPGDQATMPGDQATMPGGPPASAGAAPHQARRPPRRPRRPSPDRTASDSSTTGRRARRVRRAGALAIVLVVVGLLGCGRLPGITVRLLHRHQQPGARHAVPRVPLPAPGERAAVQQRLRLRRERFDTRATAPPDAARSLPALGRQRDRADAKPRTGTARMRCPR